jgi:hypothetical protein
MFVLEDLYFSIILTILFMFVKLTMKRIHKRNMHQDDEDGEEDDTMDVQLESSLSTFSGGNMLRDSLCIFLLSFGLLYVKREYFTKNHSSKTQVFTNEPGF